MLDRGVRPRPAGRRAASSTPSSATSCCRRTTPRAVPALRLHAADRRQRPVGQHHRRRRPHPPGRPAITCTPLPLRCHQGRRHEVRQDRVGDGLARPALTSPYAFYQFWLNADDRDVVPLPEGLHFRTREEIEELEKATAERPAARPAQRALAAESPRWCTDGRVRRGSWRRAGRCSAGEPRIARRANPRRSADRDAARHPAGRPAAASGGGAAGSDRSVAEPIGGASGGGRGRRYLNNARVDRPRCRSRQQADFLHGRWLVLRRGKRAIAGVGSRAPDTPDRADLHRLVALT